MKSNQITNILLSISLGIILLWIGYNVGQQKALHSPLFSMQSLKGDPRAKNLNFDLFFDVMQKVEEKYVDKTKIDPQKMMDGAIKGMVASLDDPYTFYLTPEENTKAKNGL